jgi:hypothetical protein
MTASSDEMDVDGFSGPAPDCRQHPGLRYEGNHMRNETQTHSLEAPLGLLERSLIDEFVRARGCDPDKLADLPEPERERLLTDAAIHVSGKLAEVEARSHFLDEIHDGPSGSRKSSAD